MLAEIKSECVEAGRRNEGKDDPSGNRVLSMKSPGQQHNLTVHEEAKRNMEKN